MNSSSTYTVAVRALCEFTAKAGDLDLRFTPSPTAQEGIVGHKLVANRRAEGYEREVSLAGDYKELRVRGRADGYDAVKNRLEEIKTFRGDLDLMPQNHRALHWAQVKIYGWLMCQVRSLEQIELALVYFDIVKQKETSLRETFSSAELRNYFEQQCEYFLVWARQELAHRKARNLAMAALKFPHPQFRAGQRVLAEAVYQAAVGGKTLLAEAPTGIGKTIGTLFPLLKALPRDTLDRIFFLSAKTPGRRLALNAIDSLKAESLRTLELVARDKSCEHPDKACHGESCPLAQGFYDRLPAARQAAVEETLLTQNRLREISLSHGVCPYYLSQEMARWSDVVIGDYNYYFDLNAMLYSLTNTHQWKVAVLVDEAHNLVERARGSYSAELNQMQLRSLKKEAPEVLKRALEKVNREWNSLNRTYMPSDEARDDYCVLLQLPNKFLTALQLATAAITDYLTEHPFTLATTLTQFYFDALHFLRVAELFDDEFFLCDLTRKCTNRGRPVTHLCLRNLIPAALLRERFETAHSATLFSATLRPAQYYLDILGLPENTRNISVPSPFSAEQLHVRIASDISTRFRDRASSVGPIADLVATQYQSRPGNYLAFFSSYDYLNQVLNYLKQEYSGIPVWAQDRRMDETARHKFLEQFQDAGQGIGFAVLGGAFAEGIDLPGKRLIGAFVATLGLPQVNSLNEQLKQRLSAVFGDGYNYTYLYPGLRKVVQAAGRVIRTEDDRGIVYLIDDRFDQPGVRRLLPSWWEITG